MVEQKQALAKMQCPRYTQFLNLRLDDQPPRDAALGRLLRVQRALPFGATTTCHGFVSVEIMIGDIVAWDGSGSGEGKPRRESKCGNMGRSALHTPVGSFGARNQAAYSAGTCARTSVSIVVLSLS